MAFSEQPCYEEFVSDCSDESDSDDSQADPTFDSIEGTRSKLSRLSIQKMFKPRLEGEGDPDIIQVGSPAVLDDKGKKRCETVEEAIKAGQWEELNVDRCKVYLRKHGLRLAGNKDTLIQRIREHIDILDGGGERKYPASSFRVNCKGDACAGDVVLFEQNVYEMFNLASRSANGPPCGTRLVAGRIVKESYGAEKQQHTFTIEVLWCKGEKPLPPLHQLLIKGRNLYRLKTMRQEWEDETERTKILSEKHARGYVARSNRETRVQEKEMRKTRKLDRILKSQEKRKQMPSSVNITLPVETLNTLQSQNIKPKNCGELRSCNDKTSAWMEGPVSVLMRPAFSLDANVPSERYRLGRQPLTSMNCNLSRDPPRAAICEGQTKFQKPMNSVHGAPGYHCVDEASMGSPLRIAPGEVSSAALPMNFRSNNLNLDRPWSPRHIHAQGANFIAHKKPVQGEKKQPCRYDAHGRCYYGYNCKWLHQGSRN